MHGIVPGYSYFKKLTTQEAQINVGTSNLVNFPVLVSTIDNDLKHTSSGGKVTNINGFDIVFTSSNGSTIINHQIERYNPVTGELIAWVKIPLVSSTVNTDFFMYFGNATVSVDPSSTATWDSNFMAAYHLTTNQNDATANGNNLSLTGTSLQTPAVAGDGRDVESTEKLFCTPIPAIQTNGDVTLETWVNFETVQLVANDNVFIACGALGEVGVPDNTFYSFNYNGAGANTNKLRMFWEHGAGVNEVVVSNVTTTLVAGTWYHLAAIRDVTNGVVRFFIDGIQLGTDVAYINAAAGGTLTTLNIGESQDLTTRDIDGDFDEIRISNSVRSPEWIQATFETSKIGSTFISYSVTACVPPDVSVAGSNQTICATSVTMSANTPTSGVGTWSVISGSGVITNSLSPTTAITGLSVGANVFEWAITSGTCTSVSDVTITVDANPSTSNAGSNQTLCISTGSTTLNGNNPAVGTGTWSVLSGTATITSPNSNNTTVTGLTVGTHVLQWEIGNGVCATSASTMTIIVDPATSIANAGSNQTVCISSPNATLAANTPTTGTGTWSVLTGGGVITSSTNPNSTVTGLTLGTNILEWTITSAGTCSSTSSTMTIIVDPATSIANAGSNQTVCISSPNATLAANTPTTGTGTWSVISGGGVVTNSTNPNTTVTGLTLGTNVLQWTITSAGTCSSTSSTMTIIVDPATSIANAGPNQTVCISSPNATLAANTPTTGVGTWSVLSGTGIVTNSLAANSTVTNLSLGTNILEWTITSAGTCSSTSSTMTIIVDPATSIANAGSNQTVCISSPNATLAANTPTTGTGTWSVLTGGGVVTNSINPNTTVTGLTLGTNVLQWSITSAGTCSSTSSTMTIIVDPATSIANAGSNQTVCISSPNATLAANTPTTGVGTWSVLSGTGVITNSLAANSTVTNLSLGTNILEWTITSAGTCSSTASTMTIIVDPATSIANAGPNQTVCIPSPNATLAANTPTTGVGTWSVLSGTGVLTNSLAANSTVTNLSLGTNILEWTITSAGTCSSTSSTMTIIVDPATSIANAGSNQTVCISSPNATLAANTPTTGTGTWSVLTGGGVVTSSTNPNTTVTGLTVGNNILEWTITSAGTCSSTSSTMTIIVDPATSIANAGSNQTVCISSPNATLAANTPTTGTGTWSVISGGGVVTSSTNPNTTVTGLTLGTNVLQWTITSAGTCSSTSSTMTIIVDPATSIANAGPNQTVCISSPNATLAANTPTTGTGTWSVLTGGGVVTNSTNPNTTVTGLTLGTNVLQWSITSAGTCSSTSSTMTIIVDPVTSIANAGSNQTVCISSPNATLAANTPTTGTGTWSVISGGGVITSSTNPNTTVTGLTLGNNILEWTITSAGTCSSTSSTMTILVDPATSIANSGSNQTVCISAPNATLAANTPTTGVGTWSVLSGTGIVTNSLAANSTVTNLSLGTNILQWTITSAGTCSSTSSTVTIIVDPATSIANAGPNQTVCISSPNATLAANTPTTGVGTWSVLSGTGVITNSLAANSTLTNLSLGTNILEWTITSAGTCSSTSSTMTIVVDPATSIANAGSNQTVCISSPNATLAANTPTTGTGTWSVLTGGGVITSSTNPNSTVTGLTLGTNILEWTITSAGTCSSTSSTMTIIVDPATSIANAGSNQTVCISSPNATLAANTPTTGTGTWSVISGGGVLTSSTNPNSTVTGLTLGTNILEWTITSAGTCSSTTSTMTIIVDPATSIANAGSNQTVCISSPNATLAANTPTTGVGTWSVLSGTGVITNSLAANSTVTNLSLGTNILEWTITSAGTCSSTASTMTIIVDPATSIANAGPNQTVCISSPNATLAANTPTTGVGTWSVLSGTGVLTNSLAANSTVTNLSLGTNILEWTITSAGTCSSTSSTMTIIVDPATSIANAGPNQTVCISSPNATLAANTPTTGTGTWSVISGGGVIASSTNPNTTVTGLTLGTNVLQWSITSAGTCSSTSSTMTIVVDPATSIANAGPNQTVCISSPNATLAANSPTTGVGTWLVLSGTGVVTNSLAANSTVTNLSLGTNILEWTITSAGTCSSTSSTMTIIVDPATSIANAGSNQTVCISSPNATLAANTPTTGVGTWSVLSGTGIVTNSLAANSTVINLSLGTNVLQWSITSAGTCSSTSSIMTIIVDPATSIANAGPNQTVCISSPNATLAANTPTTGTGIWSVISGGGVITSSTNPNTTVTGLTLGANVLEWTITSAGTCSSTSSTMTIVVDPATSIANAGPNQTVCISSPNATLAANTPTTGTGTWSVISGGGVITSSTNPNTTVTGLTLGNNILEWTITSAGTCSSTSSTMTIIVDPATSIANAGSNQTVCISSPNATLAANTPTTGVGTWSVLSGTGIVTNSLAANSTVTNLSLGTNILEWTITSAGTCSSTSSTMTIIVDPATSIANAGSNQTVCISSPNATLAANTPTTGTGTWSVISGGGVITSSTNPNTTVTGLTLGTNVLQWSITSAGTCSSTSSTMTIIVDPATSIANAGSNQTVCISSPNATLAANTPTTGTGTWSVLTGGGVVTNSINPNTTVTGLTLGTNVLQWSITSAGTCSSTSSTMTIIVDPATSIANAGPNQTVCISSPNATLAANTPTTGTGTWSVLTGGGVVTSSTNPNTTITGLTVGNNILEWTITSAGTCSSTSSTMTIIVDPATSIANAGPNQTVCISSPNATLAANTPTTGTGTWSVISGGGVVTSSTNPNTTVTGLTVGNNILEWTITSAGTCSSTSSTMTIIVDPATSIANAGPNQTVCISSPNATLAANTPTTGVGTWSVLSGTGIVTNSLAANSTVTNLSLGTNILEWTITSAGTCSSTSSTMTIIVDPATSIANAGPNQTVCISSPNATLAANTPTTGTGTWSVLTGGGVVTSSTNPNTTVTGLTLGANVLEWTITSAGTCSSTSSTMTIVVDPATSIANAGPNQTVCISSPNATLAANTPTTGTGTWSVISGGGVVTNSTNPNTTVTGLTLGTNVLQWSITSAGTCSSTSSTMTIIVDPATSIANAGSNQTVCISSPNATLAANTPTTGTGTWSVLTGGGVVTSSINPNTTITGLTVGNNILEWTITSAGTCSSTSSTMTIIVDPATSIANAGPNQTVCISSPNATLAANTPTTGTGTWSVLTGGGVVASSTNPNTTVTGLTVGANILEWTITSAGTCSSTSSTMTIIVDPATSIANAGSNQTVCISSPNATLAANTPTTGVGTWSVLSGTGVITNSLAANSTVTNLSLGTNILEWTITSAGTCSSTSSTMTIIVDPATSIANAGSNQTVCISSPNATLAANTPTTGTGTWSVISGGGVITNSTNPNTTVTGLTLGNNILQWTITSAGTCSSTSSTVTIIVDPATSIANAGPNQTVCISSPNATLAANTPTTGVGTWSVLSGTGILTNSLAANSTITNLSLGTNILEWTITSAGTCSSTSSTMTIIVDPATSIANAGSNQTVCISSPNATLAANTPTTGTGTWSVLTGGGVVTNSINPNTTVTGLTLGTNVLQWNITSVGTCSSTSSTMTIIVDPATSIANAGPNQTVCISSPNATLAANTPTTGTGTWSVISGGGVITSSTNPNTTVTGLTVGNNILEWTITSAGTCSSTSSTMTIQVDPLPSVSLAGPNQTLCISNPTTTLAGNTPTSGVGTWSVISGSATISNVNNPTTTLTAVGLGTNVLQWTITNNGACPQTVSTMTIFVDPAPSISSAGPNQTLCISNPTAVLAGNTPTSGVGTWSVISGSATISNVNNPTTALTAVGLGTNVLQWSISNNGACLQTVSTMTIFVDPAPSIALAGPNQTLCVLNPTTTLAGNTPTSGVGTWSVISGSATIANINNPTTTLTAVGLGTNVLQWTITNNGACPQTVSTMTVFVDPAPSIATAGPNQTLCISNPTTVLAANTPTSGVGTWSVISGSATISNVNNATTTLTAVGLGTNVLQWTITNNGACPQTVSTMTVFVDPAPSIANAGSNQTLCISNPTTVLAANTPTSGVGTWSVISGSATIANVNNPTTTLTAVGLGTNVLQWTIANNGACPQTVSTMTVFVDPAPSIALAGANQTLCVLNPTTTLAANTPTSGVGTWSVILGSATIGNVNNPTTTLTAVGLGTNVLQWTITNNGACPQTVSTKTIFVDPAPSIAMAGPNQTLCILNPTTTLAGNTPTSGVGTWAVIIGSAIIISPNNPSTTVTGVGPGINVLQWSITNNGACPQTVSTMVIQVDPAPSIAMAGSNQTLCILNPTTTLAANTPTSGVGTWSVISGSATISNINNPSTTLTAVGLGTNVLQWTITNNGACPQTVSTMTVFVDPAPSIAAAGPNQTLCISNPTTVLAGNTPTSGVGTWSVISGSATIANINNPTTTLTAVGLGTNVLQWTITNNGACPQTVSTMTVFVDPAPSIATAGPNQTLCISNPTTVLAANTPTSGVGTWSVILGSATIGNVNNPATTLTSVGLGTNVLQWTITNNGACPQTVSTMTVFVDPAPSIAAAGPNQTLCISNPTTVLAGNTPTSGVGTWSVILGSATISNVNNPTTTLTAVGLGTNVLQWTITNNGACPQTVSTMTVFVDPAPSIANAGSNQTLCISNPTAVLAGNTPTSGVGTWSVILGSATISNINNPTTTLTAVGLGTNVLQWSITNNGACPQTISTMTIFVDPAPSISLAGPNQTLCVLNPTTTLTANTPTSGVGTWSVILGSATISNINNPSTTLMAVGLGTNVLQWTITNNGACPQTVSTMTVFVDQAPSIALAGSNQTVCILTPSATLAANTPTSGTGTWSVISGSGTFNNVNNPTTTVSGLSLGTNILQWSITNGGACPFTSSTMTITVDPAPSISLAGPNQTLCILNPTTTLAGNTPTSGVGTWSVISGSATIGNINNPTTSLTAVGLGTNVLQWSITNNGACPQTVSTMTIFVDQAPSIALAGSNQTLCVLNPTTTLAGNTPTSGVGTWSVISGSATISNINNPTTTLTAVGLGTNVIQWSITNGGACPQTVSTMTIFVDQAPSIALAGPNQTLCVLNPTTTLAGNTPTSGVGTWSVISGSATIGNINNPTTNLTAVGLGTNVLQWSITNNGACPQTVSTVTIIVDPAPSISAAGPNQTVCISSPNATLAANTPTTGLGTWSVISGGGTITSPNSPTSTVTGLALGINILQWSISNGVCATTTSTMSIQVDNLPTVATAGPSQTLCISNPSLTMAGNIPSVGTGSWSIVLGSATITTPTSGTTTATNLGLGQNIFLWTISNGVCNSSSSSVVITIDPLPSIAVAGSNQTVCISSPSTTVNGNTPAVGTGTWSVVSGNGTITSVNNPTTTVTNLALGTNVLQWSIGTVGCAPTISTLSIKVDQLPTIASAGPNQTLCINNPTTTLNANTPIIGAGTWSIMQGGGVLTNSNSPNSSITGMPTGTTVLQWSITNGVCAPSISTMSIQVDNNTIVASAGPNQTLCAASPSTTLAGNTPTVGVGTWVILVGSGSITTPSLSNTTVTNLGVGTNILQWTIVNGVCAFNSSIVYIYVVPSPGNPNAGPSQTLCISNPTTTIAANTPSLGTASWSVVSGSANIVSPTTNTSNVLSIAPGNNVLAWTMTYSVCSLTSTLNLHVDLIPSAPVAGPNQTVCISSPTAVLAANTPTSGAGTWSVISGSGTVTTPTLATSSVTGLGLGVNVLQWTINGGGCGTNSSTMSIQVDNIPTTAAAGPSQTLCISNPTTVLAGNTPTTGIGTWSVIAGSGTISNPNSPTSAVTGLGLGLNTLQWTIANGVCVSTSTLNIQVDNVPTIANAGSSQSICISTPTFALTGNTPLVGTGTWSVISGSGTITTPTLATSSVTGLGAGLNVLQWTIANGICGSNSSTMSIQVDLAPTVANAGSNQILCISSPTTTLNGNTATVGIGTWSITSGSGVITNSLLANSTVTNLALGLNILEWNITSGVCGTTTSTMSIQVDNIPTIANAGSNQTLCINSPTYTLAGNTPVIGTGTWSIIAGSGTIATPTLATSAVTGLAAGVNILEWTIANGACGSSTSTMSIQVDQLPTTAIASSNQTICITNPTTTVIGNVPTVGTGIWTLFSGTGAITSATSATTTLTGLGAGINVFEWTISNGSCASSVASVTITVDPAPTIASAGSNQTVCISTPTALMSGNIPAIGTGSWTVVSGSGTITSTTLANTTITNLGLGVNVFAWTISNNCSSSTSTVSVTVDQVPTTAVAGSNQTICISTASTTLNGNAPTVGTGIWTLASGSGTIVSPTTAVTTVTNIGMGTNVFDWTISNGSCPSSVSSITITVDPAPTIAAAGPNQTICISTGSALMAANNAAVGTGSWSVVSGSGTFANINLETTTITGLALGNNIYAWTIFSGCGSTTSTVSVFVDQAPTIAAAGSNQTICITSPSTTLNGNAPAVGTGVWTLASGSGTITSPTTAVTTVTNIGLGVNVFDWTITNGSCAPSVSSITITVDPAPTIAAAGPNQTVCISSAAAVMAANNAAVGTGSWSVVSGSGTFANINLETTNVTGMALGTNVFAWTIFSNCGSSVSNVTVVVDQAPTTAVASTNQTICIGNPTATINGNVPTVGTGTWTLISGTGTITSPGSAVTTVTNMAIGNNVFEWSISNGVCAPSVANVTITVDPPATAANAGPNQTVCVSSGAVMAANPPAVGTGTWSVVSGSGTFANINLETSNVTGLTVGTNIFAWTISSTCGSSASNVTIIVDQAPTIATASTNQTICINTPTASISGNIPTVGTGTWTLISGSGTITTPGNAVTTVTNLAAGVNIFEWSISNGVCAPSTAQVQITVDPLPTTPVAGPNQTVCISSGVTMAANTAAVGTGSWSVVSGSGIFANINLETTSVSGLAVGTNVYAWTIFSNCGSSTSNVTITVHQVPTTATAVSDQTICAGTPTAAITGNVPGVGTGTWTLVSGSGTIVSPGTAATTVTNLAVGVNVFEWSISNGVCAPSTASVQITVDPMPTIPVAGANQTICAASSVTMNANVPAIGTGSWTVVSGSGVIVSTTLANTSISGLGAGTNVFAWTISNNCSSATSTVAIIINPSSSIANAGPDQNFCGNTTATLNANIPSAGTGTWSVISGGASVTSPNVNNSAVTGLTTGTNILVWTIANGSCPATNDTVKILIDAVPVANAGADQSTCSNSITLNANAPLVGTGVWSVISGTSTVVTPTLNNSAVTGLSTPTNVFVWTVTNGMCPASTDTVIINVSTPSSPAFAGNDTTVLVNQVILNGNNPSPGIGVWTLITGSGNIISSANYNTLVNSLSPGLNTFQWTITDACGTTSDQVNVTLVDVELPNAISPNGDGKNDYFEIPFIGSYNKVEIKIINRWGNLVYENANYNNNWNGFNQSGNPLAEDTYFYVLKLDELIRTGYITIKR